MKEYCLIPKKTAEKYIFNLKKDMQVEAAGTENSMLPVGGSLPCEGKEAFTSLPPPTMTRKLGRKKNLKGGRSSRSLNLNRRNLIKNKKKKTVFLKPAYISTSTSFLNPPLDNLIELKIKNSVKGVARAMLTFFVEKPGVKWGVEGQLLEPTSKYNLIQVIKDLVQNKEKIAQEKIPHYKLLLEHASIPRDYILNDKAATQLYEVQIPPIKKKKGNRGGSRIGSWQSYI